MPLGEVVPGFQPQLNMGPVLGVIRITMYANTMAFLYYASIYLSNFISFYPFCVFLSQGLGTCCSLSWNAFPLLSLPWWLWSPPARLFLWLDILCSFTIMWYMYILLIYNVSQKQGFLNYIVYFKLGSRHTSHPEILPAPSAQFTIYEPSLVLSIMVQVLSTLQGLLSVTSFVECLLILPS